VTAEFQQIVETTSGQDLDWFFNEWIYDVGWPEYEYSWRALEQAGQWTVNLVVDQVQANGPVFTMPVDVMITTSSGDTLIALWVDSDHESFDFVLGAEPESLSIDPYNWVLNEAVEVPHAGVDRGPAGTALRLEQNVPNPFARGTTIAYSVPRPQHARLDIYSPDGRKVTCLLDADVVRGWGQAAWNGQASDGSRVAPGTYFCRLSTADGTRTVRMTLLR